MGGIVGLDSDPSKEVEERAGDDDCVLRLLVGGALGVDLGESCLDRGIGWAFRRHGRMESGGKMGRSLLC